MTYRYIYEETFTFSTRWSVSTQCKDCSPMTKSYKLNKKRISSKSTPLIRSHPLRFSLLGYIKTNMYCRVQKNVGQFHYQAV